MFTEDGYVEEIGWCEEAGCLCAIPNCAECPVLKRAAAEYDGYNEEDYDEGEYENE